MTLLALLRRAANDKELVCLRFGDNTKHGRSVLIQCTLHTRVSNSDYRISSLRGINFNGPSCCPEKKLCIHSSCKKNAFHIDPHLESSFSIQIP